MSFTADLKRIAKDMGETVENLAQATFIELFSAVIADTPVDEGRLRGDWQSTKGSPAAGQAGRIQKEKTGVATAEAHAVIGKPGLYYLTNNMPYAARIEFDGHSGTKAPRGMVRINAKRVAQILRRKSR